MTPDTTAVERAHQLLDDSALQQPIDLAAAVAANGLRGRPAGTARGRAIVAVPPAAPAIAPSIVVVVTASAVITSVVTAIVTVWRGAATTIAGAQISERVPIELRHRRWCRCERGANDAKNCELPPHDRTLPRSINRWADTKVPEATS